MNSEKLKISSSIFSMISLLVVIGLVIAMVAAIGVGIALTVNDSLMDRLLAEANGELAKGDVYAALAVIGIVLPLIAAMFFLAYRLFRNICGSHTPFTEDNVKILKWISYLILILAVPVSIVIWVIFATTVHSSWAEDATVSWGGFSLLLVAVMFYFMARVFEHGVALQKESDETL